MNTRVRYHMALDSTLESIRIKRHVLSEFFIIMYIYHPEIVYRVQITWEVSMIAPWPLSGSGEHAILFLHVISTFFGEEKYPSSLGYLHRFPVSLCFLSLLLMIPRLSLIVLSRNKYWFNNFLSNKVLKRKYILFFLNVYIGSYILYILLWNEFRKC